MILMPDFEPVSLMQAIWLFVTSTQILCLPIWSVTTTQTFDEESYPKLSMRLFTGMVKQSVQSSSCSVTVTEWSKYCRDSITWLTIARPRRSCLRWTVKSGTVGGCLFTVTSLWWPKLSNSNSIVLCPLIQREGKVNFRSVTKRYKTWVYQKGE